MSETKVVDVAEKPAITTPVAEDEEDTEDWRIQAEAFKSEGLLLVIQRSSYEREIIQHNCWCASTSNFWYIVVFRGVPRCRLPMR